MIRAAVIGVGAIGRHHARVYTELESVELVAIADPDESRRAALANRYKIATYPDPQSLFEHEQLDVVSVAVPTVLHHAVAMMALERGIHVLVEKPIASAVPEAQQLIDAAAARGLTLTVGHVERFNPAVIELKRRISAGELGRIFQYQAHRLSPFPPYIRDVGVVLDLATHELDLMRYVVGSEVEYLHAEIGRHVHHRHEDMLSGILRFGNGVVGVLDINWLTPTKVREARITGERGMFLLDYLKQEIYFYQNSQAPHDWDAMALFTGVGEGNMTKIFVNKVEPLQAQLRAFVDAAEGHTPPIVSGGDGLRALALAELLIASGAEGRVINVAEEAARRGWPVAVGT